jgi:hypothetical protein
MSSQLTVDQVASRLSNFPLDRYLYIGGFMRGVAWAAGTVVLLRILRNPSNYLPRLLPWIVSFLATMVTLMTWGRGVLFTNSRADVRDSVIPTLMGITEFCLFAILLPRQDTATYESETNNSPTTNWLREHFKLCRSYLETKSRSIHLQFLFDKYAGKNFHAWHLWFFVLGIHAFLAVLLVSNRLANTDLTNDFDPKLCSLAPQYMQWMHDDKFGAIIGTGMSIASGILMLVAVNWFRSVTAGTKENTKYRKTKIASSALLYVVLFILPTYIFYSVITKAEEQRQIADKEVTNIKNGLLPPCFKEQAENSSSP